MQYWLQVEVVVGVHNGAVDTFNLSAIFGSLNDPAKFATQFFNFSGQVCRGSGKECCPAEQALQVSTLRGFR